MKKIGILGMALISLLFCIELSVSAAEMTSSTSGPSSKRAFTGEKLAVQKVAPDWGVSQMSVKQVSAFVCVPLRSSQTYDVANLDGPSRYCTSGGSCYFSCNVDIPTGAKIVYLELDGCDSNANDEIAATLYKMPFDGGNTTIIEGVHSGDFQVPGCIYWGKTLTTPETVDNSSNTYWVQVMLSYANTTTTFSAIRIGYQLQVSPPPAYATFTDVPVGHWAHQYVQALYASGITTGYDDDTYRPGAYVTRGQMAAFLSRALGLHWAD